MSVTLEWPLAGAPEASVTGLVGRVLTSKLTGTILPYQQRSPPLLANKNPSAVSFFRGDSHVVTVTVLDAEGAVLDLTDADLVLTAKMSAPDEEAVFEVEGTSQAPETGVAVFAIGPAATEELEGPVTLSFDVQVTKGDDVWTVFRGQLSVLEDVTR